ncbi:MAG: MOSC domain-containing protein, partial [Gammaproteobacteria bacterium]|nr:MOSC domain-containing protein [Gammaproteobacteria bacterium]
PMPAIAELNIYPVKSLTGYAAAECELTRAGLRHDRRWMVVRADGEFLTQRTHPQMALLQTEIRGGQLVLSGFGMDEHVVPAADDGMPRLKSRVWRDSVDAVELGVETAGWLSQALGEECKLVAFPGDRTRQCDRQYAREGEHTHFADGFPLLILSRASLENLNAKLSEPVGMERFRANIVVDGCEPHAEDAWTRMRANGAEIRLVKQCARCSVPTVDPQTGILAGPEPIHTLSTYRDRGGEVLFGMNAVVEREGALRVGDEVEVT